MRTDDNLRKTIEKMSGMSPMSERDWQKTLKIALDDIYANHLCLGKNVSYEYFVNTTAAAVKLIMKNKSMDRGMM